jgi:Domain of unknown function (DUF5050)
MTQTSPRPRILSLVAVGLLALACGEQPPAETSAGGSDDVGGSGGGGGDEPIGGGGASEPIGGSAGGPTTLIAELEEPPISLAMDDNTLYWGQGSTVASMRLAGGTPTTLATDQPLAVVVAIGGEDLFWTCLGDPTNDFADGMVQTIPLAGGTATTIAASETNAGEVIVEGDDLLWTIGLDPSMQGGAIRSAPKDGSGTAVTVIGDLGYPANLRATSTMLYFNTRGVASGGTLHAADRDGSNHVELAELVGKPTFGMELNDTHIYFGSIEPNCPPGACGVFRYPLAGGSVETVVEGPNSLNIAIDDSYVYYGNDQTNAIERTPLDGGPSETLATMANGFIVSYVTVDDDFVYWGARKSSGVAGQIHRIAK